MRHFLRLAQGLDVLPVVNALATQPDLWNENRLRTTFPGSPHAACDDIWLLFNKIPTDDPGEVIDDVNVIPYRAWCAIPQVRSLVFDLMRRVEGAQLGRVLITRLPPGKTITPHVDQGTPATFYRRYQIMLWCLPGCVFRIENEKVQMATGEAWFIDNRAEHEVINNSAEDRLALIVDARLL